MMSPKSQLGRGVDMPSPVDVESGEHAQQGTDATQRIHEGREGVSSQGSNSDRSLMAQMLQSQKDLVDAVSQVRREMSKVNHRVNYMEDQWASSSVTPFTLWGIKTHQNVFRHNCRKTRRILNKFGRLLLKFFIKQCKQMSPEPSTSFILSAETCKSVKSLIQLSRRLYSFLQASQMKVLVDYSTHCSATRSSFSFDLTSCSVSLRGILLTEYKILYSINVASQAADDHVPCILQRTLIPYKILYSARRMPCKLTEQLVRSKEAADVARYSAYVRGRLHIPAGQHTCTPCTGHHRAATT